MKIAIYGLSRETEKWLDKNNYKYEIVGLLDGFREDGEIFGYPIISFDYALECNIKRILVIARPGSCKVIMKRIGEKCREHEIEVYDIYENDLLAPPKELFEYEPSPNYSYNNLLEEISKHEAVSFDLFDTLVMRKVPAISEILELLGYQIGLMGENIDVFVRSRLQSEKINSQNHAPSLVEIYEKMNQNVSNFSPTMLAQLEYDMDKKYMLQRYDMVKAFKFAIAEGKKVFITSDSYYSKEQIRGILKEYGIEDGFELLISCEYGTAKTEGLFEYLILSAETNDIIHIGDDRLADCDYAAKFNLDYFRVFSANYFWDMLCGDEIEKYASGICDKIKIGLFCSRLFNSPFVNKKNKHISVTLSYDIGFLFCAPIICDFVLWLNEKIDENKCTNIWFTARDGFLIKKIYAIFFENVETVYLRYSRFAAIRTGVDNEKALNYVEGMNYSGEFKDNLRQRFGINVNQIDESDIDYKYAENDLMRYKKIIFNQSEKCRNGFYVYLNKLQTNPGKIAYFDFVAKGTCQYFLNKAISNPICGFYYMQLEPDMAEKNGLNIVSFYSEKERVNSAIFDDYYFLETILTSPEPTVLSFDENGIPIYAEETRNKNDIDCIMLVQQAIVDYAGEYRNITKKIGHKINKKLDEALLRLIHNIDISDTEFAYLFIEDPFFNRMTEIKDVL